MDKAQSNVRSLLSKKDFNNICRFCLMQSPMASIIDLHYEETPFTEILFELFSTQVNSEDELPKNLCETCISQIICFYDFRKVVVASEKTLQAIIDKELNNTKLEDDMSEDVIEIKEDSDIDETCESNDHTSRLEDRTINVDQSDENDIQMAPTATDNIFTIENILTDRQDTKHQQENLISETVNVDFRVLHLANGVKKKRKPKIFTCSCKKIFALRSEYIKHRKEEKHQRPRKILAPRKSLTCSCKKVFALYYEYLKHRKEEKHPRPRKHTCKICAKKIATQHNLEKHMLAHTKDKSNDSNVCKICLDRFSQAGSLKRHMMLHTGARPYVCEFCGKGFTRNETLVVHQRIHTGEKPFLCTYCGKTYSKSTSYEAHLKQHGETKTEKPFQKPFQCQICQKVLTTKKILDKHLLLHGEKKFLCSYCGKKFLTSLYLRTHLRVHTGEKPYSCNLCNRPFAQKAALKVHMFTHTGDKPYQCTICSKMFSLAQNLRRHLSTHSEEKPYGCPHCSKSFTQSGNLRVHIRTHTGETPYKCDLCPRGFYDSSSLKKHRRRHPEELKNEKKGV